MNTISKLTEKIIYKHILNVIEEKNILPLSQFGFRREHNTLHHPARIANEALENLNKRKPTALITFDQEKAFDRVWHDGLLSKLISLKFPPFLINLISSFLSNRKFSVKINSSFSTYKRQEAGVPQGCVLSPLLYNLYTSDIPEYPNNKLSLFADDIAISTSSFSHITAASKIKNNLPQIEKYAEKWRMKLNPTKTQFIILSKRNCEIKLPIPLKMDGKEIPLSRSVKYLGISFDQRLTFVGHAKKNIQNAFAAMRSLFPLLVKPSLSLKNKRLLYITIIRPILLYGAPMLLNLSKVQLNKLQILQNKCLRLILNKNIYTRITELHERAEIEYVNVYIARIAEKFYEKTSTHENPLIKAITSRRSNNTEAHKHPYMHEKTLLYNKPAVDQ